MPRCAGRSATRSIFASPSTLWRLESENVGASASLRHPVYFPGGQPAPKKDNRPEIEVWFSSLGQKVDEINVCSMCSQHHCFFPSDLFWFPWNTEKNFEALPRFARPCGLFWLRSPVKFRAKIRELYLASLGHVFYCFNMLLMLHCIHYSGISFQRKKTEKNNSEVFAFLCAFKFCLYPLSKMHRASFKKYTIYYFSRK